MEDQITTPVSRACTACRAKKTRCLSSQSTPGLCERCFRKGIDCVVPRSQPRPHKDRLDNRVAELEKELRTIKSTLLSERRPVSALQKNGNNDASSLVLASAPQNSQKASKNENAAGKRQPDVLDQSLLTEEEAEAFLERYRHMARYSPYVIVPRTISVSDLRHHAPILLLSILVVASSQNKPLQLKLDQEYLKLLSGRFVIDGENSLDMLQGLLVYISWCHFHLKSVYRLTALAVAIVVDLGINRRPKVSEKELMRINFAKPSPQDFSQSGPDFWDHEARRAFVGCYVLCTRYSLILRKHNHMAFTPYVEACALSLAAECRVSTDAMIPFHVRIVRHGEEVNEAFGYSECNYQQQQMNEDRLQFCIKAFKARLEDWRASIPPSVALDCAFLNQLWYISEAHTYEIGLYGATNAPLSVFRTNLLFDCLSAAKNYFDAILTIPQDHIQDWSTIEWTRLHYCVTLVIKLTLGIDSPSWDIAIVRQTIKLESYLEVICQRVRHASTMVIGAEPENNPFTFLIAQWELARHKYQTGLSRRGFTLPDMYPEQTVPAQPLRIQAPELTHVNFGPTAGFENINFMASDGFWFTSDADSWPTGTILSGPCGHELSGR